MTPDHYQAQLRIIGPVRARRPREMRHPLISDGLARRPGRSAEPLLDRPALVSRLAMIGELSEGAPLSFVAVKVCGLRELHHRRGWVACEELLQEVAGELSGLVRATDSVGRLNASTFGVVLQGTGATAAAAVAARLTYRLNRLPEVLKSVEIRVGAATGTGRNVDTLPIAAVDSFEDDAV